MEKKNTVFGTIRKQYSFFFDASSIVIQFYSLF